MWSNFLFFKTEGNKAITSGVDFKQFTRALGQCGNYLLLAGESDVSEFDNYTLLEYVQKDNVAEFIEEPTENWGDFCWIDFNNVENLKMLKKEELAELYYMIHRHEIYKSFEIEKIDNKYAYLCHDDGIWNNVYYKNIDEFHCVIKTAIKEAFAEDEVANVKFIKNGECIYVGIEEELINELFNLSSTGVVVDFCIKDKNIVYIYPVKDDISNLDSLEETIKDYRDNNM